MVALDIMVYPGWWRARVRARNCVDMREVCLLAPLFAVFFENKTRRLHDTWASF